ncbi:hypothetical protein STHU_11880 [Allostella humosa]|nr:hypothetical protein STHU_11880 [Stella humosa]
MSGVKSPSIDRATAERSHTAHLVAHRNASPVLSVASGARDHTLGRPGRHRIVNHLFWLLVLAPAVLAALVAGPLVGLVMLPLQLLAAILIGTAFARRRQCGAMTLASLPLTALAMVWVATSI